MSVEVYSDIRVVVAIDFGTTFSGYAYAHKSTPRDITVHSDWEKYASSFKTPTVIKYKDDGYTTVKSWGFPALAEKPTKKNKLNPSTSNPIELFKLHLLLKEEDEKPFLPDGLDFKNVIRDFMREMGNDIKENLNRHWKNIDFHKNVLIVLTVPAEFDDKAIAIFRDCVIKAGLVKDRYSNNVKFTTEPEAAAICCLDPTNREEIKLTPGVSFMVVDCGGGTVDLTTRELLEDESLGELTERTGDYCGSSCVDKAFFKFISERVGASAIESMKRNHYDQLQFFVHEFCKYIKLPFTGIKDDSNSLFEFDLEESLPAIKQYASGEEKNNLEEAEWVIKLTFEELKEMFDSVIVKIIHLIKNQLDKSEKDCSAMLLVGGFSESKYLQARIREEFGEKVPKISVPPHPISSVVKGGVLYGLKEKTVKNRILKRTYGTDVVRRWKQPDPLSQRLPNGYTIAFETLAQRGKKISLNEKIIKKFKPLSLLQDEIGIDIFISEDKEVKFCDDPGVNLLRNWQIELPENENLEDVIILFTLTFGVGLEVEATAKNQKNDEEQQLKFKCE